MPKTYDLLSDCGLSTAFGSHSCPGLVCWYLNEKVARRDLTSPPSQEKSLLHIRAEGHRAASLEDLADPSFLRVYSVAGLLACAIRTLVVLHALAKLLLPFHENTFELEESTINENIQVIFAVRHFVE